MFNILEIHLLCKICNSSHAQYILKEQTLKHKIWAMANNPKSTLTQLFPSLTCMVTMRGRGWRVLAPPSIAIPRVLAFFTTRTSVAVGAGTGEPVCWTCDRDTK